jgi:Flp pilus assembly protein TadD
MSTAFLVLLLAAGASDAERAEELNREASAISQTGDYAAALAKYLEAVELAPDNDLYVSNAALATSNRQPGRSR